MPLTDRCLIPVRFYAVVSVAASEETVLPSGPCAGDVLLSSSVEHSSSASLRCRFRMPTPKYPRNSLPRPNRPAVLAWPRANPLTRARFPFPPAALSPLRPARTNPGRPFPKGARPTAALTRSTPIGKPRSPGPAAAAALPSAPSSSLSGSTAIPTEFGWAHASGAAPG